MSQREKLHDNITAIRVALNYRDGVPVSPEDVEYLKAYNGWGSHHGLLQGIEKTEEEWVAQGVSKTVIALWADYHILYTLLEERCTGRTERQQFIDSMKNSALTSFYTPAVVPETFYEVLNDVGVPVDKVYDPSSGNGIFVTTLPVELGVKEVRVCEKDLVTGLILKAMMSCMVVPVVCQLMPFEETPTEEDGQYNLVVTNPPYGDIRIDDSNYPRELTSRIHNYFFVKGLDKLTNGGLLAYLVTDAFLNTPGNREAREYLFNRADFISLTVMPDNLMKESAGTEAPSHFLVVQKREGKQKLSAEEEDLIYSGPVEDEFSLSPYNLNYFIQEYDRHRIIGTTSVGTNQYGKPALEVTWKGPIEGIKEQFYNILREDFGKRYRRVRSKQIPEVTEAEYEQEVYEESIAQLEDPLVQYGELSPREKEVMQSYIKVRDSYNLLQELEQQS